MLFIDNGSLVFKYTAGLVSVFTLISDHFTQFGLEMNIGTVNNPSKTECDIFPPPVFSLYILYQPLFSMTPTWFYKRRKKFRNILSHARTIR